MTMVHAQQMNRRDFLRQTMAVSVPLVVPAAVLGAEGQPPPSARITIGVIGMGQMGMNDLNAFLWAGGTEVVAVCDVDSTRSQQALAHVNKFYANKKDRTTYKGCRAYNDFRELVARDDIDAVVIATPDHWHVLPALAAVRSGKDVYCEKPLSLTIAEGRVLSDAVRRFCRVFQVGSQQRSDQKFRFACELVRNGRIGQLKIIKTGLPKGRATTLQAEMPIPKGFDYDTWLGQAPWAPYTAQRCHYNFRFIHDYAGGQVANFGAHHNDIAQWGNGTDLGGPVRAEGKGVFPADGLWDNPVDFSFACTYANGVQLQCSTANRGGVLFEGTEGQVYVTRGKIEAKPESLLTSVIGPAEIHLYESRSHSENFIECVRTRRPTIATAEIGHRTATVCHLGNIAMDLGRPLQWDPDRERFVDDPEADRLISRQMRAPWSLYA